MTNQIYALVDMENAALPAVQQSHGSVLMRCKDRIGEQINEIWILCNQWSYYDARYETLIVDDENFTDNGISSWMTVPFPVSPPPLKIKKTRRPNVSRLRRTQSRSR